VMIPHQGNPAQFIDFGQAVETDSTFPMARMKRRAFGLAAEADSAGLLSAEKLRQIGQAVEVELAQPVAHRRERRMGLAAEVESAGTVHPTRLVLLGLPVETDAAFPLTYSRHLLIGLPAEADEALSMGRVASIVLGLATETDEARRIYSGRPPFDLVVVELAQGGVEASAVLVTDASGGYALLGSVEVTVEDESALVVTVE